MFISIVPGGQDVNSAGGNVGGAGVFAGAGVVGGTGVVAGSVVVGCMGVLGAGIVAIGGLWILFVQDWQQLD